MRRKVILLIVEGPSDQMALGSVLTRLFDPTMILIKVYHGDITSAIENNPGNIVGKVQAVVRSVAEEGRLRQSDFLKIIQITDTDGTFIPDESVIYDRQHLNPFYTKETIQCLKKDEIIERNHRKQANLIRLSQRKVIWKIPYEIYYMSCNLDHVLYNIVNSTDDEKEKHSYEFAMKYRENPDQFLKLINSDGMCPGRSYVESWEKIRENIESLQRHTNLGLCFSEEQRRLNEIRSV